MKDYFREKLSLGFPMYTISISVLSQRYEVNNKSADKTARKCRLVLAFVVRLQSQVFSR